jgi:hypothetical protein
MRSKVRANSTLSLTVAPDVQGPARLLGLLM